MPFTSELVAQQVGDLDWRLVEPLVYEGNTDTIEVPAGSTTDFASVPAAFQWLIPRSGRYTKAAVLHDHLWRRRDVVGISRSDADGIFRRTLAELDVPLLRRWTMWGAVRLTSLAKSGLRDGPGDIGALALVLVFPGLFVLGGGAVVMVLLVGFYVLEVIAAAVLWSLRGSGLVRRSTKPVRRPTVRWPA